MDCPSFSYLSQPTKARLNLSLLRRLACGWCVAILPSTGTACAQTAPAVAGPPPALIQARAGRADLPEQSVMPTETASVRPLPINFDTVLRLAEEQNGQVALARARVREAYAEKDVAGSSWLPSLDIGTAYFRHEGAIANEDGTLTRSSFSTLAGGLEIKGRLDLREAVYQRVNAERTLWQQKGELRRVTSETLVDAAGTYVDLLTARTGEAIATSLQKDIQGLLERAKKLADPKVEPGARVEVFRIQAQLKATEQVILELREQAARASAKLAYTLGLDPSLTLVPADERIVPFELVNANLPVSDLVGQALANGPGIREMEGLLAVIHESIDRSKGPGKYLPVLEMHMFEGGFGTGPGDQLTWDNRWDLCLQAKWSLTECLTARDRQRVLQAKTEQAHLSYQDLRAKLTLGVQESREAILSGREQIRAGEERIREARQAYELSDKRLRNDPEHTTYSEVLLGLQAFSLAQVSYLNAIRNYDKAQLRLMVLLGPAGGYENDNCPSSCGRRQ